MIHAPRLFRFSLLLIVALSVAPTSTAQAARLFEQPFVHADPTVYSGITVASDVDLDGIPDLY